MCHNIGLDGQACMVWGGGGFCVLAVDGSPLFGVIRVCMHTWVYIDKHIFKRVPKNV